MKMPLLSMLALSLSTSVWAGSTPAQTESENLMLYGTMKLIERDGSTVVLMSHTDQYPGRNTQSIRLSWNETDHSGNSKLQLKIREPDTKRVEFNLNKKIKQSDLVHFEVAASETGQAYGIKTQGLEPRDPTTREFDTTESCSYQEWETVCNHEHCWQQSVTRWGTRWVRVRETTYYDEYKLTFTNADGSPAGVSEFNYNKAQRQYLQVGHCDR